LKKTTFEFPVPTFISKKELDYLLESGKEYGIELETTTVGSASLSALNMNTADDIDCYIVLAAPSVK
jgi:hypothetical protein